MTALFTRLAAGWRQRGQHRPFRIPEQVWSPDQQAQLVRLLAAAQRPGGPEPQPTEPLAAEASALDHGPLADAATNLWRARRRLERDSDSDTAPARQAGRYLRNCADALTASGLLVQDHDGQPYHPGRSLTVLHWRDDPTLDRETVVETVRPSIYLRDRSIQTGQVVVGRPGDGHGGRTPHE